MTPNRKLGAFVKKGVPERQARCLFYRDYEGAILGENRGCPRPANRFFPAPAA